jgi:hypothetical protein
MAGPEEIGKVKITVDADTSGVKAKLSGAKDEVKDFGREAESAGDKGSDAFRKVGDKAEGAVSKLSKMTGAVGAVVAAISGVVAAVKAVNDYLKDGSKLANEYLKQFDTVANAESSLDAIGKRLIEVNAELERIQAKPFTILGRSKKQIEEEIAALRDAQQSISRQVRAQRAQEARETAEAFKKEARKVANDIEESFLPGDLKTQRAAQRQKDALIAAAKEANVAIASDEVQNALRKIDQEAEILIEAYRQAEQEKIRTEQQESQRRIEMARNEADAYAERLREKISGIFGADFTTRLDNLTAAVRDGNNAIRRLK